MTDEIERLRVSPAVLVNVCVKPDGSVDLIPHPGVVSVTQPASMAMVEAERVSLWNRCRDLEGSVDAGKAACASLRAERDDLLKVIDANWVQHQRVVALRKALERIIDLDHHNMGSESQATKIARAALQAEAKHA